MIVGGLTTCHTQYTWDRSTCVFLFNRKTLLGFVTYLTGALYVHTLWFYKHEHDNRVRSMFVACQRSWFQWRFWFVPSIPGYLREEEEHKPDPWHNLIEWNHMELHLENEVVETQTIILNNPICGTVNNITRCSFQITKPLLLHICQVLYWIWGMWRRSLLTHCAKSLNFAGSIPHGVAGIFHWHNPSCRTMTRGAKAAGA